MISPGTFWRTVRHLRREQLVGRAKFRLARPKVDLSSAPCTRGRCGQWVTPPARASSLVGTSRMRFLNEEFDLDAVGWDEPSLPKLWRYNLHYFDDLNAVESAMRTTAHHKLITRWIAENRLGTGTGWEPYPTSLRIVNWIKWFTQLEEAREEYRQSLALQTRWLSQRLEFHLLGNHLFSNAKALMFAGLFFGGAEGTKWLDLGETIALRELPEQVLPDGGHFERSPMYHALMLEDVLDLLNAMQAYAPDRGSTKLGMTLRDAAARMLAWSRCMCHPDGSYPNFNDCAQGIAPGLRQLQDYAAQMDIRGQNECGPGVTMLSPSGYARVERGDAIAFFDIAEVGPSYLPAHAHADTLSIELSLGGRRVVVNGGTSCYGVSARRHAERGTAMHSTVQVESQNSSEVWGGFRVGRRARPFDLDRNGWRVSCSHDGFTYLPGKPVHRRCLEMTDSGLIVEDAVSNARSSAVARFLLAPGLRLEPLASNRWIVRSDSEEVASCDVEIGLSRVERSTHAPEFGRVEPVDCLAVHLREGRTVTRWSWRAS